MTDALPPFPWTLAVERLSEAEALEDGREAAREFLDDTRAMGEDPGDFDASVEMFTDFAREPRYVVRDANGEALTGPAIKCPEDALLAAARVAKPYADEECGRSAHLIARALFRLPTFLRHGVMPPAVKDLELMRRALDALEARVRELDATP